MNFTEDIRDESKGNSLLMNNEQLKYLALFDALSPQLQECIINIEKELLSIQKNLRK